MEDKSRPNLTLIIGSRWFIKRSILDYCAGYSDSSKIWLVDSLQVFDPYYLSSTNPAAARQTLNSIRICRPFTAYQLRERVESLKTLKPNQNSTIIISAIDSFKDDISSPVERQAFFARIASALKSLFASTNCRLIVAARGVQGIDLIKSVFAEVEVWEEPSFQRAARPRRNSTSFEDSCIARARRSETRLRDYMLTLEST